MKLSIVDFFAGIGGIRKGIEKAANKHSIKIKSVGYSDIKKESCFIYPKLWGEEENLGDITKIKIDEMPDFDMFLGGFPCQSYSMAGKRLGLQDERGQLIYNIFSIIKKKQPKFLFLENVNGILTIDEGETIKHIMEEFDNLGYTVKYYPLNSKDYGVPQSRQRVYFLGINKSFIGKEDAIAILANIEKEVLKSKKPTPSIKNIMENKSIDELETYHLNEKQFKMVLLKDSFCGSLKGVDTFSNGVTKTYDKISGQSTKVVFDKEKGLYLLQSEIQELYESYKGFSIQLKELKKKHKKTSRAERAKILDNFFSRILLPEYLVARTFSSLELGRLQGYNDEFIQTLIDNKETLGIRGTASLFGDSVSVPVIEMLANHLFQGVKTHSIKKN